jgi:hypothetical protein
VAAGTSLAYYGALARGDRRINADIAQQLQRPLRCAGNDLLVGVQGVSVPLRLAIAAAESEERPDAFDLSAPYEWLQPRRLADAENCLAAEICDDSAELDFVKGTILVLRPLAGPGEPVPVGAKIVVRFGLEPAAGGEVRTHEILYGILDQSIVGDLLLITRTRNRLVPRHALIQTAEPPQPGLGERPLAIVPRDGRVAYARRADDPAEILGIVVYSMKPE